MCNAFVNTEAATGHILKAGDNTGISDASYEPVKLAKEGAPLLK